jgi:hypothetical protein
LAVAVWAERGGSPYFDLAFDTLSAVIPFPPGPDAPGPFRLGPPGALEAVLRQAGFTAITIESRPFVFGAGSPEEYVEVFTSLAFGVKDRLAALGAGESDRLRAALAARARAYLQDGRGVRLTATPLCATARK